MNRKQRRGKKESKTKGKKTEKIVLTGGHAGSTALAVIKEIKRRRKGKKEVYWIGLKKALRKKEAATFEYNVFPQTGVKFYSIISGKIQRKFILESIISLFKIPFSLFQALFLLLKIKPSVILSFGGFPAFPVVVGGWILRIPVIIHEQTSVAGLANRWSSPFASIIALAREESKRYFPESKCIVVGNPVLKEYFGLKNKDPLSKPKTILITGGSRGAEIINNLIGQILENLLQKYNIIHQTGLNQEKKFKDYKEQMPEDLRKGYQVFSFVFPDKWYRQYGKADIIISRAGANSVSEIIAAKRPAIFIPIPWTYLSEQTENAKYSQKFGFTRLLEQESLTSNTLMAEIDSVAGIWPSLVKKANQKESPDLNAAEKLVDLLEEVGE